MKKSTFALFIILGVAKVACGGEDPSDSIAVEIGDGGPNGNGDGSGDSSPGGSGGAGGGNAGGGRDGGAGDVALAADVGAADKPAGATKMDAGPADLPPNADSGAAGGGDAKVDLGPPSLDGAPADGGACMPTVHPGIITFIDEVTGQVRMEKLVDVPENLWWRTTTAGPIPVVKVISRLTPGGRVEITLFGPCDQLLERTTA